MTRIRSSAMSASRRNYSAHGPALPTTRCFRFWAPFKISPPRASRLTICRSSSYAVAGAKPRRRPLPRAEYRVSHPSEYLEMHESVQKGETRPSSQQLRTLLEVAEAIVSNRELSAIFKNLAGLLHRVARFDYLWLNFRDGADDTLRLNVMEPTDPEAPAALLPVQDLAMWVWQNQRPVATSITSQAEQWPDYYQWAQRLGMNSFCVLPLTTAGRRLGSIGFGLKQPG